MNQYVTGAMIKRLRENKNITQQQLAEKLNVTDKAVSKWETNHIIVMCMDCSKLPCDNLDLQM